MKDTEERAMYLVYKRDGENCGWKYGEPLTREIVDVAMSAAALPERLWRDLVRSMRELLP